MAVARRLNAEGWEVGGTCRQPNRRAALGALGIQSAVFRGDGPMEPSGLLAGATHVLLSIPPADDGDPALRWHADNIAAAGSVEWVGYLSTTGVYGNRDGDWVDEASDLRPSSPRSERRVTAECDWLEWSDRTGIPLQIFRLAGIYGPGRSVADQIKAGTARRITKTGHVFSRIHVEDIATVVAASIARPRAGGIYNLCDDEPAAPGDVVTYACSLMEVEPPPEIRVEDADLSPMAKSFWMDNRRVSNHLIKSELGVKLAFPDYRMGIRTILGG
jgi:nucleoside-diphosphate-sugar epimerase